MEIYKIGPETARLRHRSLNADDAERFYALNSDPEVMRHTCEEPPSSVAATREAIANYPDFDTYGFGRWGCVLKGQEDSIIGFCGLKFLPELDEVDVGYRFFPQFWGQGIATEACAASVQFGFEVLGLGRIIGLVRPENIASIRVLEKVGMLNEGEFDYDGIRAIRFATRR